MTAHPKIAIGALGGTIAMVADATGGVQPTLTAETLIKSVAGLSDIARIHAETLAQLPSASLSFSVLFDALFWANQQIDAGAAGIILTQGTDTLEETAFLLGLYWQRPEPLIVTGAMRTPLAAGADGPANLLACARVVLDKQSRNRGVLVVMNDTIHSPYFARKSHTVQVQTFQSGFAGPLGTLIEGKPIYFSDEKYFATPLNVPQNCEHKVALVQTCLSSGDDHLKLIFESGLYDGVVLAGFGTGHVSSEEADIIKLYAEKLPVVMATRSYNGPTTQATYGYKGSEMDLIASGVLMAGWLSPVKARLQLWAYLGAGWNLEKITSQWKPWPGC